MAGKDSAATPAKPKRGNWFRQMGQVFSQTRQLDPKVTWWMALTFVGVLVLAIAIGFIFNAPVYAGILGVPLALLAAVVVMSRRAERAAYAQVEGQPGAAAAALSSLRRGWFVEQQPVAAEATRANDPTSAAMVFRAVGRPGVVLVAEGPSARAQKLLVAESKKISRVAPGVPVTTLRLGDQAGEGVVPVRKLAGKVRRLRPVLTKDEVSAVNKRLKALGGVRPPVPAGVDPNRVRMDRKAMRGR